MLLTRVLCEYIALKSDDLGSSIFQWDLARQLPTELHAGPRGLARRQQFSVCHAEPDIHDFVPFDSCLSVIKPCSSRQRQFKSEPSVSVTALYTHLVTTSSIWVL